MAVVTDFSAMVFLFRTWTACIHNIPRKVFQFYEINY